MIFKELAVKNYGNIKSAKIDLDYKGITCIYGRNKDAGPKSTNGAGKSQFWNAIPEIGYGSPPTGKDGHKHKSSAIRLTIEEGENTLAFQKNYNKSGTKKFKVLKNGKDVNVRTLDYTEKKLQQYLGKTEEDFYTKVYVDSLKVHPLINGSAAMRQDFFVRMFNLENVDSIRKLLTAELSAVQKIAATYREVKALFEDAKAELTTTAEEREALEVEIKFLQSERNALLDTSAKLQTIRDLVAFERDNEKVIARFNKLTTVETFADDLAALKKQRKTLKAQRESALEWKAFRKAFSKYKTALSLVQIKLRKYVGDEYADRPEQIKNRADKYREANTLARRAKQELDALTVVEKPEDAEAPKYPTRDCETKVSKYREELSHAKEFHDGKCPTCGSSVKARSVDEIKADLQKWKARLEKAEEYDRQGGLREAYDKYKTERKRLLAAVDEQNEVINRYAKFSKAAELLEEIPDKPEKPEGEEADDTDIDERIDSVTKKIAQFESIEPVIERLGDLAKLTDKQRERVKAFDKINDKLVRINTELSDKEAFKIKQDEAVRQLEKLKGRGKVLKRQAADEPILKSLVKAYSTKGLKKLLIQRYATLLQNQVNKFVRFVFSEDFTFEFKYDTRLDVLVHRKYGKSYKTTDVKRLSGAEKRMFTLLLVIATYTLTPKKRRSNILILDEMEANMGPAAVQEFLKALPVLNKIVPHIVVITPRPELVIEGARCFTAVKHRGVTTLVEGRVQ